MAKRRSKDPELHVVTDGTGGLPRHFLTAVLSQFPELRSPPQYHLFCDTPEKVRSVFKNSLRANSVIIHALAHDETKQTLTRLAQSKRLPTFDLTGAAVDFLSEQLRLERVADLDVVHAKDQEYFDRIDAWEFTMQHDDSRRLESIHEADVVLLGVSRVSKTPTAAYLGWLGFRVANVSFVPELGVPKEVKKCKGRIVALTMQPKALSAIRERRMKVNRFADKIEENPDREFRYAGVRDTIREVMAAEEIYKQLKAPIIDVTHTTVEETAAHVMELLNLQVGR